MLPDQYGFYRVQLHNEDVRQDYRLANGAVHRREGWRGTFKPLAPSGWHGAHSIGSIVAAIQMRIHPQPVNIADHAIETTKGS